MKDSEMDKGNDDHFKRSLGFWDATMLVAGSMIGSGIFIVSADMSRMVGSTGWLLFLWILSGVITVMAALSYGELAGMMPKAGGQFVYIERAWGKVTSFLYGWTVFTVIQTGVIAAVAVAFAKYSGVFFPAISVDNILLDIGFVKISSAQFLAIVLILVLTWINTKGHSARQKDTSHFHLGKINCATLPNCSGNICWIEFRMVCTKFFQSVACTNIGQCRWIVDHQ
jgi:APA family basic amino acid/polyamine antiporter